MRDPRPQAKAAGSRVRGGGPPLPAIAGVNRRPDHSFEEISTMICTSCGRHFRVSKVGTICDICYANSRSFKPPRRAFLRRVPATCGPHNHPRPEELAASELCFLSPSRTNSM
jgi:hypothetical protein